MNHSSNEALPLNLSLATLYCGRLLASKVSSTAPVTSGEVPHPLQSVPLKSSLAVDVGKSCTTHSKNCDGLAA